MRWSSFKSNKQLHVQLLIIACLIVCLYFWWSARKRQTGLPSMVQKHFDNTSVLLPATLPLLDRFEKKLLKTDWDTILGFKKSSATKSNGKFPFRHLSQPYDLDSIKEVDSCKH